MTDEDLAELSRLLSEYKDALDGTNFVTKGKAHKRLATALVRNAGSLIASAMLMNAMLGSIERTALEMLDISRETAQ